MKVLAVVTPLSIYQYRTTPWMNPAFPGQAPVEIENRTVAQISAERKILEESTAMFKVYNTLEKALKLPIITVF